MTLEDKVGRGLTMCRWNGTGIENMRFDKSSPSTACAPSDLGGSQMGQLDGRCSDYGNSVVVSNGVACYDGTSTGAEAVYFCNDGYQLEGEGTRVCQRDGMWNGSVLTCIPATTPPPGT